MLQGTTNKFQRYVLGMFFYSDSQMQIIEWYGFPSETLDHPFFIRIWPRWPDLIFPGKNLIIHAASTIYTYRPTE